MKVCKTCKSYKKGKGSPSCIECPEIKQLNILSRAMPCVEYVKIPREILEALSDQKEVINIYNLLSVEEATIIFYIFTLNLTHQETADHLGINKSTITRRKKAILSKLRTYLIKD